MSELITKVLSPIRPFFEKEGLVEICINREKEVWCETRAGWERHDVPELTLAALLQMSKVIAGERGQQFNQRTPRLSTTIPGYGYRIQVNAYEMVETGIAVSIRVGGAQRFPLESYMDSFACHTVTHAVTVGRTILVVGGTSSGKTTLMNSLLTHIPQDQRIITVEDSRELVIDQPNHLPFMKSKTGSGMAATSYKEIINDTNRHRPSRIILGELDIENTVPFLRLINTGHAGCMATLHANGPMEAIEALLMNAQMDGAQNPDAIRAYIMKAVDLIVHIRREEGEHGQRARFVASVFDVKHQDFVRSEAA